MASAAKRNKELFEKYLILTTQSITRSSSLAIHRYWDIMGTVAIKAIARNVCLNLKELRDHSTLPKAGQRKYGERIIKLVKGFLAKEGLLGKFDAERRLTQEFSPDVEAVNKSKKIRKDEGGGDAR